MSTVLCRVEDLEATGSKGVHIQHQGSDYSMFVVRSDDGIFAYINRCPHAGAPLEMQDDEFLNEDREYIVCAMHGALFEINNGLCVDGPCYDESLSTVPITIVDGEVRLDA